MKINEIFYSIQGEGKWSGKPNIFIRTTGCNLRCSYCDTKYAYIDGKDYSIDQILETIKKYPCEDICITGGEPLLQEEMINLINELTKRNYKIIIETNGSKKINDLIKNKKLTISMDIKTPSSGMEKEMIFENIILLREKDQIKFIIKDKKDYDYAKKTINTYKIKSNIYLQPEWNTDPSILAERILKDGLSVKLGLQIHKILWNNKRGK